MNRDSNPHPLRRHYLSLDERSGSVWFYSQSVLRLFVCLTSTAYFYSTEPLHSAAELGTPATAEEALRGSSFMFKCFVNRLKQKDISITTATEIYLYDALTNTNAATEIEKLSSDEERKHYCLSKLVTPYLELNNEADKSRRDRNGDTLGPLGGLMIETESVFIGVYHNITGKEAWGHADITGDALKSLRKNLPEFALSSGAVNFLQHASQTPDLYHWSDITYHAHTPDEAEGSYRGSTHNQRIWAGQQLFRAHIRKQMGDFLDAIGRASIPEALLALGVISHGVQDLVYHRGMTLNQHAGLAYGGGFQNPDFPLGVSKAEYEFTAREYTMTMLDTARQLAGPCAWRNVLNWNGLRGDSIDAQTKEFWSYLEDTLRWEQDIGYFALINYYGLAKPYKAGGEKRKDLENWKEANPSTEVGLIVWDIKTMLDKILNEIRTSETIRETSANLVAKCN